ncbi:Vta1 like-domain-containing protein [Schizophyllum commune]
MAAVPRFLGLQPVTPNLKPIVPYLQRAEELRTKDPIMTYWCAYYAAQVGIALKAKDNASRAMLFELLTLLEKMKEEIGANDAIDLEAASSAYVENFALKVFTMADNEDRRGHATRSTAKKFLAAANFLEILKTFKPEYVDYVRVRVLDEAFVLIPSQHEDKIRYAKWKASDIAKAIREGRKPTPGPAGGEEEDFGMPEAPTDTAPTADASAESTPQSAHHTPQSAPSTAPTSPDLSNSTQPPAKRSPPPPKIDLQDEHYRKPPKDHLSGLRKWGGESEPTPGSWSTAATPGLTSPGQPDDDRGLLDAGILKHVPPGDGGAKAVHFAPSEPSVPPPPPRASSPPRGAHGQPSPNGPGTLHTLGSASSGAQVPLGYVQDSVPGPSSQPSHQAPVTVELTPQIIAKTQKHCRFAISALDYEDTEQAKKELRAALAILGG